MTEDKRQDQELENQQDAENKEAAGETAGKEERNELLDKRSGYTEVTPQKKGGGNGVLIGTIIVAALAIIIVILVVKPFGGDKAASGDVAAEVNGEVITKDELLEKFLESDMSGTLDRMIEDKLIAQQAEELDVEVTEEDINAEYEFIKNTFSSDFEFQYLMEQSGLNEEKLKEQLKDQLRVTKIFDTKVEITDEEMKTKFETYQQGFLDPEERIRASHILVEEEEKAKELLQQIKDGANFAELAKANSTDGSAQMGGNLDYFTKGDMVEPFSDAAFKLGVGEVSEVVKSEFGYHIIKVTDVPKNWTFEDKQDEVRRMVLTEKIGQEMGPWMEELKADAKIEKKLNKDEEAGEEKADEME
ncbi:peptidylprolyl isomerase [Marinicrinis sediminis]|uniref:peptidylprolyl isomerase n=1 Tax=Marinicrinis sediminis TaxID=1652465 RepID=A0ABW5RB11_9BACL